MKTAWRLAALVAVCTLALQLFFLGRIALMRVVDPQSTAFQRSEAWRLLGTPGAPVWRQAWVDYGGIAQPLKRAVIASEDAGFADHAGIEWEALERAWQRNQRAAARSGRIEALLERRAQRQAAGRAGRPAPVAPPKVIGGSTITQQLAKNLFLSGERSYARKTQELVITALLEALLPKQRILELYLNSVEWGEGVFGAEAAAQRYFRVGACCLGAHQAAQLAVLLPAPKRFERRPASHYIVGRAGTVAARMGGVALP